MSPSVISYRIKWFQLVVGIVVWCLFYTLMLQEVFILDWTESIIESLSTNAVLGVTLLISILGLRYYQPSGDKLLVIVGAAGLLSAFVMFIDHQVFAIVYEQMGIVVENRSMLFHGAFAFMANAAAISLTMQWNQNKFSKVVSDRKEEAQRLTNEAELLKLRHQLQPHFLFNSLNSINALININPEEARKMVFQLSSFLRGTIKADDAKFITLKEELEHIKLYLEIEKVRFGHRLNTEIDISDEAHELNLPPLLLQPLMENAIKFGLYGTTGDVVIGLKATTENDMLVMEITNPIDNDVETQAGTGFGLSSIERRLNLLFGRNDLMTTLKTKDSFSATLKIPQA